MNHFLRKKAMIQERVLSKCRMLPRLFCKMMTFPNVLKAIGAMLVGYLVLSYLHQVTYVWQCTTLGDTLRPVSREVCPILPDKWSGTIDGKRLRIGILMVYDDHYGGSDERLVPRLIRNREVYCAKHDCTVISGATAKSKGSTPARPPAWEKLTAILMQLNTNQFDYILYVDMDMIIMNPEKSPESFLRQAPPLQDFILTNDWSGVNTGVMFVRNSEFSKWFLQTAYNQVQLVEKFSSTGTPHPFEYEQRAFHFLLNTEVWQSRNLPRYQGNSTELRSHFTSLPQCSMNSYLLHPLEFRANREESHYIESDFIVHLAGKKGQIKTVLTNYFLTLAEEEY